MKTIEEKFADLYNEKINNAELFDPEDFLEISHYLFIEGVKFAQRWINCEEELPTKAGKYLVKRKINNGKEWIVLETWTTSKGVGYWENSLYITHWRPINIE